MCGIVVECITEREGLRLPSREDLKYFQAMPLDIKVAMTKTRIREWVKEYGTDGVYVSFSGGKDSTVLLHIVRELYPNIEAVFVDTGLEYPEIREFVKTFSNVTILRPKMRFDEVIKKYGYPLISKDISLTLYYARRNSEWAIKRLYGVSPNGEPSQYRADRYGKFRPLLNVDFKISNWCCLEMKEKPMHLKEKEKKPIIALLAEESERRTDAWLKTGCNAFDSKHPMSKPMSFWTEQDVLKYIKQNTLSIASVYGDVVNESQIVKSGNEIFEQQSMFEGCGGKLTTTGCKRTGCMFCGFGCHLEKESRWLRLKKTHPRQYEYCIGGGEYNEEGIWQPNSKGLGLGHCFDVLNEIYGKGFIKYKENEYDKRRSDN